MKVVGIIANVLVGMVTCEIVLTNIFGWGSVGSNTTTDQGPCCRCNWLVENQLIPIT